MVDAGTLQRPGRGEMVYDVSWPSCVVGSAANSALGDEARSALLMICIAYLESTVVPLVIVVVVLYATFVHFLMKNKGVGGLRPHASRRSTGPVNTWPEGAGIPATGSEVEHLAWTALDDLQHDRLLRDSW